MQHICNKFKHLAEFMNKDQNIKSRQKHEPRTYAMGKLNLNTDEGSSKRDQPKASFHNTAVEEEKQIRLTDIRLLSALGNREW